MMMVCALLPIAVGADPAAFELTNEWWQIAGRGPVVSSVAVDAAGRGRRQPAKVVRLGFQDLRSGPASTATVDGGRVTIRDVAAMHRDVTEVVATGPAEQLQPGHTLGQSFTVPSGTCDRVEAKVPTWYTKDSGCVLRLRRDGPEGEVLAERRLENAVDNAWQALDPEPLEPGRYCLELAEPQGTIGWWCRSDESYQGGEAFVDGRAVEGRERSIRLHLERVVGTGSATFELDGARLRLGLELRPAAGEQPGARPVDLRVTWDNSGYDTGAAAVPFSRFFADNLRYMPVEQLKRWPYRDGRYELSFDGAQWIEADGTGDFDLRFAAPNLGLAWQLDGQETSLLLTAPPQTAEGVWRAELEVGLRPRDDALPEDWPRFALPDDQATAQANRFFYERAFSWPAVWGGAAWFEWDAVTRAWQLGEHLGGMAHMLGDYPISDEGYVHTWGADAGWPFPDTKRYDTRHFDTNARFVLACWRYAAWTGDTGFLQQQAARLRRAMEYQLTVLHGQDGLIVTASKDVNGKHGGVGDNYWDILPFGHLDAYANSVWYASLEAMAQIEELLASAGGTEAAAPTRSPAWYRALAAKARQAYNATFWDEAAGRYIGCVDIDGGRHDYGFTFVNLEAMAYGLADPRQVERIYHWMETEPTSSGKADTYTAWTFAPRATTLHNPQWNPDQGKLDDVPQEPWWFFGWHGTPFGDQCQDGGAILYTSFYDLLARARYLGADNAWSRWEAILGRVNEPDRLCGGPPLFHGEQPQQLPPGSVGVDIPFPESGLVPCWLLYGVLGVEATSQGLVIRPQLPNGMPWAEIQNLGYHGLPLTLRATRDEVTIVCQAPGHELEWKQPLGAGGQVVFVPR